MLRTNLSTRPFYNERAVYLLLGAVAVVAVGITAYNLWEVYALSGRDARVGTSIAKAEVRAGELRTEAARIRSAINPREIETLSAAAREANGVIDRRVFSWTDLFNHFERTLPESVRIASVRPQVDRDGRRVVAMVVVARDVEGVNSFIENLERAGAFEGLLSREEFLDEEGLLRATLEGRYLGGSRALASRSAKP